MDPVAILTPNEILDSKPFTDPRYIKNDVNTLRFMVDQVRLFLEDSTSSNGMSPPIIVHQPSRDSWFYRLVIAKPEQLMRSKKLAFVGFLGHRKVDADIELADDFDEILVDEIPDYPGLLCYSTMAMLSGDFSNLVIFTDPSVKQDWRNSKAHEQAVNKLAPDYYESIKLYNGQLLQGLADSDGIHLTRIKYFDYQASPRWHSFFEIVKGEN